MSYSLKTESAASTSPACSPKSAYPRFPGRGSGLRYYIPAIGRWLNRDPIVEEATLRHFKEGKSKRERRALDRATTEPVYVFVLNDAVNLLDQLGLRPWKERCCIAAALGFNTWRAGQLQGFVDVAGDAAQQMYPDLDERNAFLHCYAMCMISRQFGRITALTIGECHELYGATQDPLDTGRDRWNNLVGSDLGIGTGPCQQGCVDALDNGDLLVAPAAPPSYLIPPSSPPSPSPVPFPPLPFG